MASHETTRHTNNVYREAHSLLEQTLALLDSVDDSLAAAQLSHVIELVEAQISTER